MPGRVPNPAEAAFRRAAMEKTLAWYEKRLPHLGVEGTEDKCFQFVHGILYIYDPERGETKIRNQVELITHRNMIVQVSEHILKRCDDDFDFYEQVHNPKKSLENCIKYINNQAKKVCDDMVKLNGNKPGGAQSIAIEGDQVFQWAVEYFGKENLTEDGYRAPAKPKDAKGKGKKGAAKGSAKPVSKPAAAPAPDSGQQSLF
jgi:hypothetical protein